MRLKLVLFTLVYCCLSLRAQQAAYFILGENQFKGIQVYDVVQDKDLNYWIATNEGLFYFNHYTYQKIECDKAKSNAVFNFVITKNGAIYCHNLNHQVFQIKNKTCSLFYELKEDEINSDISLSVTNDNLLLIGAKKIIQITEEAQVLQRFPIKKHYLGPPYYDGKQNTFYHLNGEDSLLVVSDNKASKHLLKIKNSSIEKNDVLKFFAFNAKHYALSLKTKALFEFNAEKFELNPIARNPSFERSESIRLYFTGDEMWIAGTLPGVAMLNKDLAVRQDNLYYEDFFISDVYKDAEGNVLLSTFDKGILVIPDMRIPDVIHAFKEDPISSITHDAELGLWMGSSKGKLFNYNNQTLNTIDDKGKRPIEKLYNKNGFPLIIFDNGKIRTYNKKTKVISDLADASLKDAVIVSENLFYLGTNRGIIKCIWKGSSDFSLEYLKDFGFRIYSMCYNPDAGVLYASTSNGLFAIGDNGSSQKMLYNNEAIFPNTLAYDDGLIYATHKKGGVLVIENATVKHHLPLLVNGEPEAFNKIIIHNKSILAKSLKGLFQFDLKGNLINTLSTSQGFSGNRVIDFTTHDNNLWVSHTQGVQQINLNKLQQKTGKPTVYLSQITVNDIQQVPSVKDFSNAQRKIQFTLSSPTLRNRESIRYHYKLEGNDDNWSVNDYSSNQIIYNALAPGNYTFLAKAEKQGVFSDTVSYSFSIASPFYARWWFISIAVLIFLGSVYSIYKWQLSIQRKKSQRINELNASKLTAIQSQMNPHFIFNSLNSIQDLILKGDVEHSYSYITTFSNLVRRTLSYSDKDFIDFEQEIKLIELYLSLEQLRFKKDFSFSIDTKDIVDIQIPPMLIQPFIENALVHGLLHKEGEKKLSIKFELKEVLICTIEDNGIGREKAKAIKLRQRSEHESFSVKAIRKRFDILSEVFEGAFGFTYTDLKNGEETLGTRVTLNIPIKHKY